MKKIEAQKRWLIRCCYWYYVKSQPLISDYAFDMAFKELEKREQSVGVIDLKSPTQMIYGDLEDQYPEWAKEQI